MTVDMLATAFIWPEEMLVGRPHIGDDLDPGVSGDGSRAGDAPEAPEPEPFWAGWMRRFRADPPSTGAELR